MTVVATHSRRGRLRAGCEDRRGAAARPSDEAPTLFSESGGEPTLDELMSGVWEGLAAQQRVSCPLCGGGMVAGYGAHARPIEGRCGDCGTTLS